jgi:hypothetical protein
MEYPCYIQINKIRCYFLLVHQIQLEMMATVKGPQLYDIRFKNERIAYELSLQEIAVFYSGHKPTDVLAHYLDGLELIGFVIFK